MGLVVGFLVIYLVILVLLLVVGVGVGFVLHWLIPGVDMGLAVLIGVLTSGMAIHFYGRLTGLIEEAEPLDEEPPPGRPVSVRMYPVEQFAPRRSRKRKP
ncbi:MAG TPA: hypothetical protein VF276_09700 [Chloroflexia bacterium]